MRTFCQSTKRCKHNIRVEFLAVSKKPAGVALTLMTVKHLSTLCSDFNAATTKLNSSLFYRGKSTTARFVDMKFGKQLKADARGAVHNSSSLKLTRRLGKDASSRQLARVNAS